MLCPARTLFLSALLITGAVSCAQVTDAVHNADGSVELGARVFETGSVAYITGPWEFYWGRFIPPADFHRANPPHPDLIVPTMRPWSRLVVDGHELGSTGLATYRMRLRVPEKSGRMGIWFPNQISACWFYVNGELQTKQGTRGSRPDEFIPGRVDSEAFFSPAGNELELVFHIGNSDTVNGGMRGSIVIGSEAAVRRYVALRGGAEMLVLGIVLGAAIYHLFFYFMHRTEYAFLFFALLCVILVLRIPFQGSKTYSILLGEISWDAQVRFLAALNIIAVPVAMAFVRGLFPDKVSPKKLFGYLVVSLIGLAMLFGNLRTVWIGNIAYVTVVYPVLSFHMLSTIYRAFREGRASVLMGVGVGTLLFLSLFAFFQNYFLGREAGPYALVAFLSFVIFQALALSRFFLGAVKAKVHLSERLQESYTALSRQREELQVNLHDSLGGALTDLQIHVERQLDAASAQSHQILSDIHGRIASTVRMFRSQLLFMEDLAMAAEEPLPGIQMTLLRRYAEAGREIDFDVVSAGGSMPDGAAQLNVPMERRLDLFFLMTELCTNDLKYGTGESFWRLSLDKHQLRLTQRNGIRNAAEQPHGEPASAAARVRKLGGRLTAKASADEYSIEIVIPSGNNSRLI
ncbi:MAG: hypothetical protein HY042_08595 [Spirochaetia bacterium]|nr:hypothetical protein [Spirochaetia bacterium]